MKPPQPSENGFRHELLAAYADGELDAFPALKQQVAALLAGDLDIQTEMEQLNSYQEWWQTTVPADPGVPAWTALLARLEQRLGPVITDNQARSRQRRLWQWAGLVAAVVAFVGLGLGWLFIFNGERPELVSNGEPAASVSTEVELLSVAAAEEVEILSMAGADTPSLVIGDPPVRGPLELLAAGEASLADGNAAEKNPDIRMRGPRRPMVWARLDSEENDE